MSQTQQLSPAGSMERSDSLKDKPKVKTRRPPNTAFRQQRLKAWQPILTPKTVIPLLIVIGVIFGPLGGLLLYASSQVQEIAIDYSQCYKQPPGVKQSPPSYRYSSSLKGGQAEFESHTPTYVPTNATIHPHPGSDVSYDTTNCTLGFYLPADIAPPIYVYYRLTNFYQNHRRYTKSYNQQQLNGDHVSYGDLSACDPLRSPSNEDKRIYYPCGLIANSYFNDTFGPLVLQNPPNATNPNEPRVYNFSTQGIAWSSDKDLYNETSGYRNDEILPPPNWQKRWPNGYTESEPQPDLKADESFQNWMRTAGLPTFSKLVMRNEDETLLRGQYNITIVDNFHSDLWGGKKELLISTRTVMGGKNSFLGIAYVVVAGACVLLGTIFTITNLIKPRRLGDHSYLSWNNDKPAGR